MYEQHSLSPPPDDEQHSQSPPPGDRVGPFRRLGATLFLALALLGVGGVAVVSAASPDPSGSPAATESDGGGSTDSTEGTEGASDSPQGREGHDCPEREGDGSGSEDGATDDPQSDGAESSSA